MAREALITQEQVSAAADMIRAAGQKPTSRSVRESLGVGSMATVLKYFQVWKAKQVRAEETPVVLPAGLQRALVDFIGQEVASAKAELQDELVSSQQANGDLIAESERQASTIEQQAAELEIAQAEKAELSGRLAQVEVDLSKAGADVENERHAAELARTELAKAQLRLEALPRIEAEVDRLRAELEQERAARVTAEQSAAVAAAKLDGLAELLKKAEAATDKAEAMGRQCEKQTATLTQELTSARHQVQAQQIALDTAARETSEAKKAAADAREAAKKSGEIAAELRGQLAAAKPSPVPAKKPAKKPATTKPDAGTKA